MNKADQTKPPNKQRKKPTKKIEKETKKRNKQVSEVIKVQRKTKLLSHRYISDFPLPEKTERSKKRFKKGNKTKVQQ